MTSIQDQACALYKQLDPIARRFLFERPPPVSEVNGMPMVLFLGNHSAGKSSFINHLLGTNIQRTGIAPVDDGFTILMHGEDEADKDGAAVVTNPELGWEELKNFGDNLVSKLRLRTHQSDRLRKIALVDSPGMIDAANSSTDRGYDFPKVVRWFAQRADVILFLFDPDKPGTTGETVQVLKEALDGLDYKVLLVFNKVDRFESMRDFARAYGALCWNLARAFSRKDLPHIYNTYLPIDAERGHREHSLPLDDFDRAREEVLAEVYRAPQRRIDNVVSRLYRYTRRLRMHARVIGQQHVGRARRERYFGLLGVVMLFVTALAVYGAFSLLSESVFLTVVVILVMAAGALGALFARFVWNKPEPTPRQLFEEVFARPLTLKEQAPDLRALWTSVEEQVHLALEAAGQFGGLGRGDLKRLDRIVDVEVPKMRTEAESIRQQRDHAA